MSGELIIRKVGQAGWVTLNRPKALNALTPEMVKGLRAALEAWRQDDAVAVIILDGAGERAFCAGGDIREIYNAGLAGDLDFARNFWIEEYRLNAALANFPKPIVSFLHGFVMGGGVGVGCHAAHRVVDDSTRISMPECGIGLVPDVGGTLLLANAPGRLGEFMGLTAARLRGGEAVFAGFADYLIQSGNWDLIKRELAATGDVSILDAHAEETPEWEPEKRTAIAAVFGECNLTKLVEKAHGTEHAGALGKNSPLAMAATLQLIRRARGFDTIEQALEHEFRFTARATAEADFLEGIRAVLIDKDNSPNWKHVAASAVTDEEIAYLLSPLPDGLEVFSEPDSAGASA